MNDEERREAERLDYAKFESVERYAAEVHKKAFDAGRESMRAEILDGDRSKVFNALRKQWSTALNAERVRSEELSIAVAALWKAMAYPPPEWIMNAPDEFHDLIEVAHKASANERKRQGGE